MTMHVYEMPRKPLTKIYPIILVLGGIFLGKQAIVNGQNPVLRMGAAAAVLIFLGIPAIERPKTALAAMFAWLPFLGLVRRALIPSAGWSSLDPLLLVSTGVSLAIFLTLMISKKATLGGTPLAKVVFGFVALATLELFNPNQGSYLVALTGVMFVIVPITLFFSARTLADEAFTRKIQTIVIVTGVFAALWGLKQIFIGFTGFERQWIECCAYGALKINTTIRPFSTFSNSLEFAGYMAFGVCICLSRLLYAKGMARFGYLGCIALMGYAGFLVGSRGTVVGTLLATFILLGLKSKNRVFSVAIVATLVAGALMYTSRTTYTSPGDTVEGAAQLTRQQVQALQDPTDPTKSSLPSHVRQMKEGLIFAIKRPAGLGTGTITRASTKFGQGNQAGVELDFGNAFLAFGLVGGLLYIMVVGAAFWQLYQMRRRAANALWAAVLGMGIISIGQWMNGGAYALASLIWFSLGASDRAFMNLPGVSRFQKGTEPETT